MKALNPKSTQTFLALMAAMKGNPHLKIHNEPYMPLIIENIGNHSFHKWGDATLYSLCHYYKLNGDLMQDPEMCFIVDQAQQYIYPYMFTQANLGIYQESILLGRGLPLYNKKQQADHTAFADGWLTNILEQEFLEHALNEIFYFQIMPTARRTDWKNTTVHKRLFPDSKTAIALAQRTATFYRTEVRLSIGAVPSLSNGKYFSHKQF